MGFLSYLSQGIVKTGPNGERLLYLYGPWSRPYIIPDLATERRLIQKGVWIFLFILLIVILPITLTPPRLLDKFWNSSLYFMIFLIVASGVAVISAKIAFQPEIRHLTRVAQRPPFSAQLDDRAKRNSYGVFAAHILICLVFIVGGILTLLKGRSILAASVGLLFFGGILVMDVYALSRKLRKFT